jgi:hypothetical protein
VCDVQLSTRRHEMEQLQFGYAESAAPVAAASHAAFISKILYW